MIHDPRPELEAPHRRKKAAGRSPAATKTAPRFQSSRDFPQQRLRGAADPAGSEGEAKDRTKSLSTSFWSRLRRLEDDYGSYAPAASLDAGESPGAGAGVASESAAAASRAVFRPAARSGAHGKDGAGLADLRACASDADAEIRNNCTSNRFRTETFSADDAVEIWDREPAAEEDEEGRLREHCYESSEPNQSGIEISLRPKIVSGAQYREGEVEVLHGAEAAEEKFEAAVVVSVPSDPLKSSAHSSLGSSASSSATPISKSSASSSSSDILRPPKRATGGYDPFGNSDFSVDSAAPLRRVRFEKKAGGPSALRRLLEANTSPNAPAEWSDDDSVSSFAYLRTWCGFPEDFEESWPES